MDASYYDLHIEVRQAIVGLSREERRSRISEALAKISATLEALRRARNSAMPIAYLPDEILSMIFLHYATVLHDGTSGKWTRLMRVCRRWRGIGLNMPQLWSYLSSDRPFWTFDRERPPTLPFENRLKRTAKAFLTCRFTLGNPKVNPALDNLRMVMTTAHQRVRSLTVQGEDNLFEQAFRGVGDLPSMKSLSVVVTSIEEDTNPQYVLPAEFIQPNAPRLRSLALTFVLLPPLVLHQLENLTHLELNNRESQSAAALPSFQDVIAVILRSPRLTSLVLSQYWIETDTESLNVGHAIHLPLLQRLVFCGWIRDATVLLANLMIPPTTSLSFLLNGTRTGRSVREFLVPLNRFLHSKGVPTLRSLCIKGAPSNYVRISAHFSGLCAFADPPGYGEPGNAHLSFVVLPRRHRDMRSIISKFIHALPLQASSNITLNALTLSDGSSCNLKTWTTIGQLIPQLDRIVMTVERGMLLMMEGMLAAMERGCKGVSGRRHRRLLKKTTLNPSTLLLQCRFCEEAPQLYPLLIDLLARYRDMETRGKAKGVLWERIEFHNTMHEEHRRGLIGHLENFKQVIASFVCDTDFSDEASLA